jgi:hypothetical protein
MIGHSFPTLEELPYIPIMLDNRTIPCRKLGSLKGRNCTTRKSLRHEEFSADLVSRESLRNG